MIIFFNLVNLICNSEVICEEKCDAGHSKSRRIISSYEAYTRRKHLKK